MKKFFCLFLSIFCILNLYSQHYSATSANKKTALRYLALAKKYYLQGQYNNAITTCDNALKYNDSIGDIYYLKAASKNQLNDPRNEILPIIENSLNNLEWVDYNSTNARILYANILCSIGQNQKAIEVLDNEPFIYSSEAEYIRIKSLYQMNTIDSIEKARQKVDSARRVYPKDIRFFYVFFNYEYRLRNILDPNTNTFIVNNENNFDYKIADSFIKNIPNYDKSYNDLEILASFFATGENKARLISAFDARGFKHILYPLIALEEKIISQEDAVDYFLTFFDKPIDSNILYRFISMITESDTKKYLLDSLNAFDGIITYDINNTLEPNLIVKYERGRPQNITCDIDNNQKIDFEILCDFGEIKSFTNFSNGLKLDYANYPNVILATLNENN